MSLKIEEKIWQPDFPNEIWVMDVRKSDDFMITLKQGSPDIEIDFNWDYGYDGRGHESMKLPIALLKELINKIE